MKIFSYIINFVRFRESQTATIDEHFNKAETTKARIDALYNENQDLEGRIEDMKRQRKSMEVQVKEKVKKNEELKARLMELKNAQEKISEKMERMKGEKGRLITACKEREERCKVFRQESEKLRPYALQSSAALQASLKELSENLARDKGNIDTLERRTRALQTSADTFTVVTNDVNSCTKILEEVSSELQKEDDENHAAAERRDALSERGNNVREIERSEALLQRQIERWLGRTEALRKVSGEKSEADKKRMQELREIHRELTDERVEKGREMERKKIKIEQTEKKVCCLVLPIVLWMEGPCFADSFLSLSQMADLKENIENEIHSAHDEYLKMDSHIKLYITEMEQLISI